MDAVDRVPRSSCTLISVVVDPAAAASLALIPIAREVFWGPMAYAMMGGIIAGTAITLLFLPALYVTWFRIKEPKDGREFPVVDAGEPIESPT